MSSELQLNVRCLNCCGDDIWWTLTKERQAWCYLQVKLCDPCPSALCVLPWPKKRYINTLPFLFFQKGGRASSPNFSPCLLWPNGWMDQDGTWHGGGPRSRPHSARWETSSLPQKGGRAPPIFDPCLLSPNGWMNQDGTWHRLEAGLGPSHIMPVMGNRLN